MVSSSFLQQRFAPLIIAGILILVNVLSVRNFVRFDWTDSERYTLSDSSRELLEGLSDVVTITAYFSSDLPPTVEPLRSNLKDLLDEYKAFGAGNVQYSFADPATDANAKNESAALGIQEVRLQVREKDRFEATTGYLGVAIQYAGKSEVLPVVQSLETLEYDLTSRILKVTQERAKTVGFLAGFGSPDAEERLFDGAEDGKSFRALATALRDNYSVRTVKIEDGSPIDVDTLVVAGPRQAYSERVLFEIDQFLMKGGRVLFLVDMIDNVLNIEVLPLDHVNVNRLLGVYGAKVETNMVLDSSSDFASFSVGRGMSFFVQYPAFVKLLNANFSEHSIVAKLDAFVTRWASSLKLTSVEGVTADILASTTNKAWQQVGQFITDPQSLPNPLPSDLKSFPMVVLLQGTFPSAFAGKGIPQLVRMEGDKEVSVPAKNDKGLKREVMGSSVDSAMALVVGDSNFVTNEGLQNNPGAGVFALNAIDYLTLGDALISIRTKQLEDKVLPETSYGYKVLVKVLGIGLVPLVLVIFGFVRLHFRRSEERIGG